MLRKLAREPALGRREWGQVANGSRILFNALVRAARSCAEGGDIEQGLQWCATAAWFVSRKGCFGSLSSKELEAQLLCAARTLPGVAGPPSLHSRSRWLHVLTEAYGTLGHTNLCRRWIQYDTGVVHDVILVDQRGPAPDNLVEAAKSSGGECVVLDAASPLLERAAELRAYAWRNANVVVLHTHPEDVMPTVAFGVAGGPPVLLVNHADHVFWVGCTVADLVLDIRPSGHLWTKQVRGVDRALILPLPLLEDEVLGSEGLPSSTERCEWRRKLGLPEDGTMLLTVGSATKYQPMPGLDFVATALEILRPCDDAYLVALGPRQEGAWKAASKAVGGRILALGQRPDSIPFCRAANVYLEGFPLGSLTALLEAGQAGLPCVRGPRDCVPPLTSDDLSLARLPQPQDIKGYIQKAVSLTRDAETRAQLGSKLREAIRAEHCGAGWLSHLQAVRSEIPKQHSIYPNFNSGRVEDGLRDWFLEFLFAKGPAPTAKAVSTELFIEAWRRSNLAPEIGPTLWSELKGCETGQREPARGWRRFVELFTLWHLNKQIRRQGRRERLVARGRLALNTGKPALARKLTYQCLLTSFSSAGDLNWIKLFIKAHLGWTLPGRLRERSLKP